jgi:hypothetical protein
MRDTHTGDDCRFPGTTGVFARWSNSRTPAPSNTAARSRWTSSSSPAFRHCWIVLAPCTPTDFGPAADFARATALSMPSVTNWTVDPGRGQPSGTWWVATKAGTSHGCWPPQPLALGAETWNVMSDLVQLLANVRARLTARSSMIASAYSESSHAQGPDSCTTRLGRGIKSSPAIGTSAIFATRAGGRASSPARQVAQGFEHVGPKTPRGQAHSGRPHARRGRLAPPGRESAPSGPAWPR